LFSGQNMILKTGSTTCISKVLLMEVRHGLELHTFNGEGVGWHEEKVPMNAFCGLDNVTFRFLHLKATAAYHTNGMNIDDLALVTYNVDHYAPSILAEDYAPVFYEGVMGDYTVQAEILDFSGIERYWCFIHC
jgi:hypothetical protein